MSERTTRRVALAVVVFAAALTLANIVLPALGREALNNPDADLFFGIISTIGSTSRMLKSKREHSDRALAGASSPSPWYLRNS